MFKAHGFVYHSTLGWGVLKKMRSHARALRGRFVTRNIRPETRNNIPKS